MEWHDEDFADLFAYELEKSACELKHISEIYRKYGRDELANEVAQALAEFTAAEEKEAA